MQIFVSFEALPTPLQRTINPDLSKDLDDDLGCESDDAPLLEFSDDDPIIGVRAQESEDVSDGSSDDDMFENAHSPEKKQFAVSEALKSLCEQLCDGYSLPSFPEQIHQVHLDKFIFIWIIWHSDKKLLHMVPQTSEIVEF